MVRYLCFLCVFAMADIVHAQLEEPGGGGVSITATGGDVTSITMSHALIGSGVYSLDAEAEFYAVCSGDFVENPDMYSWKFRSALTVNSDGTEFANLGPSYTTLEPGQSATWSLDTGHFQQCQ